MRRLVPCLIVAAVVLLQGPLPAQSQDRQLWLYYPVNLQVAANVDKLEPIWARAAKAGYTHVLIADSKFAKLGDVPDHYFKNVERVKQVAARLNLKLVPAVFPVGYSNDLLWHDPNLAEGLPVNDSLFVVRSGEARLAPDPPVGLDKPSWHDSPIKVEGTVATLTGPADKDSPNARLVYQPKVSPFRCYHVSVKIRTDDFTGQPEIKALGARDGRSLNWQNLGVKRTQDWAEHHVVFNSLDNPEVNLYFGVWGNRTGTLQWKDWKIEEVGLLNVLRRPGTPCVVKGDDGRTYAEGTDYEPIKDPRAGNVQWPGDYESWHEPPTIKTKTIPDGTRLRVSWYHPAIIYDGQVSACIAEPKTDELLADQAKRMKAAWGESAAGYMMSHDEFRTLGWCKACQDSKQTPGQLLAVNAKRCADLLRPSPAYVWNDMFDPHHNAVAGPYYLVNGPWTGAWEGLPKDVVIMNWNHGERDKSLGFFGARGHKQVIATYYDDSDLRQTKDWMATTAQTPEGVIGYMYTTWRGDYSKMEAFAELCGSARSR